MGRRSEDNKRQINRSKEIVSRPRVKLVKMIKNVGSKFDDYSIPPKIRRILLNWCYELTEKYFFINSQNCAEKKSWKKKKRYSKEKTTEYYLKNKEPIKEKSKKRYKNLSKEEKEY